MFFVRPISIITTFTHTIMMQRSRLIKLNTGISNGTMSSRHRYQLVYAEPYGNHPSLTGNKRPMCSSFEAVNGARWYRAKLCSCGVVRIPTGTSFINPVDLR